jgi:3-deoxy-manno-octulosonate cytidylyltransferase (CMP-KDO synthetase)
MFSMSRTTEFIAIIPARYASSRFPGKPLADIFGKSMIRRVFEQASKALDTVYVATDDERIFNAVEAFGGKAVMTSEHHSSGTDRIAEAVLRVEGELGRSFGTVLNIQGDEPFIEPAQLELLMDCFLESNAQIATLIKRAVKTEELFDPNRPKVVVNARQEALYFSRSAIPYLRGRKPEEWIDFHTFYLHIGLYGYRKEVLQEITRLPQSPLEVTESLEQLRWLENGYTISVRETRHDSFGIDTPGDLRRLTETGLPPEFR